MRRVVLALILLIIPARLRAADELVTLQATDGGQYAYVLTTNDPKAIRYAVILMPGGSGNLSPRLEDGKLIMSASTNFLIRSRAAFADQQFVAASSDATSTPARVLAIVADLRKRYGNLQVYIVGTSASTNSTMALSGPLDGQVTGFIHSSSMAGIAGFDTRGFKSRHLIVLHTKDSCKATSPSAGAANHRKYGTDLIEVEGGKSVGDDCQPYAHHGYYGIERETIDKIKAWVLAGPGG